MFAKHPGMKLLTGHEDLGGHELGSRHGAEGDGALLAKYPKIDGIIANFGTDALAAIRAFQAAGRKLVPVGTLDANGLSCLYKTTRKSAPQFQIATISNRNWLGRIAARKAIAAAEGLPNNEPSRYTLPFYEDTLGGRKAVCVPKAAPDFYSSNNISQGDHREVREGRRRMSAARAVLRLTDVVKTYPGVVALKGVTSRSSPARCTRS